MAGIRRTRKPPPPLLPVCPLAIGDSRTVHDLFYVRNMFFFIFGYWPLSMVAGPFWIRGWPLLIFVPESMMIIVKVLTRGNTMKAKLIAAVLIALSTAAYAETPEEWVALGSRVHGAFGSFIPLGIKIGLDADRRLDAKPRELSVLYYDSDTSPCACFADGIAIATYASVGQRTLTIAPDKAPAGDAAVIVIRPRAGGPGFKYTIPMSVLAKLGPMNKDLDPRGRYDAVMATDGLFQVERAP
jgi:hypothetical protein